MDEVKMEDGKLAEIDTLPETYPGGMNSADIISDLKHSFNPEKFNIRGSELQQMLIFYAEQYVEPGGWQAVWRRDPKTPEPSKTDLSGPAFVEVLNVDYQHLEAFVEVTDDQCQPLDEQQHTVALIELHPLSRQENGAVNIEATHGALQRLRFFYQFLLLPWDCDIQENWFEVHLPVRVKMFCELRSGMLNQEIAVRYQFLLSEAREVERKLQLMAEKVPDSEDEMEESVVGSIAELNSKLEQIQQDVEILLNPSTRMLLFGSKVTRAKDKNQPDVLLVVQGQSCLSLHQTLNEIESEFSPELNIRCYPSLQTALDDCRTDDIVVISKGIHSLLNISALRNGGTLIGIGSREDVVVHLGCSTEVGLTFDDGTVTLKNCTILVNHRQSGISAKGRLMLEKVTLRGASPIEGQETPEEEATSWKGVYVAADSQVALKQCTIVNFDVGLRVRASGQVVLSSSEITSCNIGILAEQNAEIDINDSDLKMCREQAIGVEMDSDSEGETMYGGIELLKTIPETFQIQDCRCYANPYNVKLEY